MTKEIGHMVLKQEKTCRLNKNVNTGGIWSIQGVGVGAGNKELSESTEEKKKKPWGGFDAEQIFLCSWAAVSCGRQMVMGRTAERFR